MFVSTGPTATSSPHIAVLPLYLYSLEQWHVTLYHYKHKHGLCTVCRPVGCRGAVRDAASR